MLAVRGVDAATQDETDTRDWSSYDLGRVLNVLNSSDKRTVKKALRRLHIRFWHASMA